MTDNRVRSLAILCSMLTVGVTPIVGHAADDLTTLRAEIDTLKRQVAGDGWMRADSQAHLAGYGTVTYKEFRDDHWHVIVNHMRVRAGLIGQDARDILTFLQSSN